MKTNKVQCPVCDGSGILSEKYDITKWEPIYDAISGFSGMELRNVITGQIILSSLVSSNNVSCFNCEGSGTLEWETDA